MKKIKTKFLILLIAVSFMTACSKDDDTENLPPKDFAVSTTILGGSVTIDWTTATDPEGGAITYSVFLDGQTVSSNVTVTSYTFNNLAFSSTFTGKVIAYDDEGLTSEALYSFETEIRPNTSPTKPVLTSPSMGEASVVIKPTFSWQASTDAENDAIVYDVYLDNTTDPTTKIAENISGTSYALETLLDVKSIYFWKVIAKDAFNAETKSERGKFVTGDLVKAALATSKPGFNERAAHTSVIFKEKMWVIGGEGCCGNRYNDVWSSGDGENWSEEIGIKSFSKRSDHGSAVFNNKIWITGGFSANGSFNDVWNSDDGATWFNVKSGAAFGLRYEHKMMVFDNKLWILGGRDESDTYSQNQVWNSSDGTNWTKVTDNAGISFRRSEFIVHNNKIWRVGNLNDENVYSTVDGKTWTLESENVPFGKRTAHSVVQYDDKIWVTSGSDAAVNPKLEKSDVWYSEDGKVWKLASNDAGYTPVAFHTSLVHNNKIFIIAGGDDLGSSIRTDDVWQLELLE